jgi:Ras homolog gene family, member A
VPFVLVGLRKDLRYNPKTIAGLALSGQRPVSFKEVRGSIPLVGHLFANRHGTQQGKALTMRIGALDYYETSAATGEGVREVFVSIARLLTLSPANIEATLARRKLGTGTFRSLFGIGQKY